MDGNSLFEKWYYKVLEKKRTEVSGFTFQNGVCSLSISNIFRIFSAINPEEKKEIKRLLLSEAFQEPIPQIAAQMAVLFGNIARFDYPADWTEVTVQLNNRFLYQRFGV